MVNAGQEVPFILTWSHSENALPARTDAQHIVDKVTRSWQKWSSGFTGDGRYSDAVLRSLITLKALTHHRTGGIVAAATTSLPEEIGGARNWDYRFCWLRDSTFTLYALLESGFIDEARAWRDWLLRAIAGDADQMQILYGVAGERRITEFELPELPGYQGFAARSNWQCRCPSTAARRSRRSTGFDVSGAEERPGRFGCRLGLAEESDESS